jgi:hypothetical protein
MAIKEKGIIYPPSDPRLLFMEQNPAEISLKKFAICDIITGKPFTNSFGEGAIVFYGTYLLEEIGLNLGDYPFEFIPDLGLVSPTLSKEIKDFRSYALLYTTKNYLLSQANEKQKEKIARVMYELINCKRSGYCKKDYLGAIANLHFLKTDPSYRLSDKEALSKLATSTPFCHSKSSNEFALEAVKRFTHK